MAHRNSLRLKPSKTPIIHTLNKQEGKGGFDFLGFHIRPYRVGQHRTRSYRGQAGFKTIIKPNQKAVQRRLRKLKQGIRPYRGAPQMALIAKLTSIIRGWRRYFRTGSSKRIFARIDSLLHRKLMRGHPIAIATKVAVGVTLVTGSDTANGYALLRGGSN